MTPNPGELEEASSPSTPPSRLSELARHPTAAVRERVAENPAILLADALLLGVWFPEAFLRNPTLPLWCLENPAFYADLPVGVAVVLARCPAVTLDLLERLAEHPSADVRAAVLGSSLATDNLQERLLEPALAQPYRHGPLFKALILHPNTPPRLLELALRPAAALGRLLGRRPDLPPYLMRALCSTQTSFGSEMPATRGLPEPMRAKLACGNDRTRRGLAEGVDTPTPILRRLASDPSTEVRQAVASNPSTPVATQIGLLFDKNSRIRGTLLGRLSTPIDAPENP